MLESSARRELGAGDDVFRMRVLQTVTRSNVPDERLRHGMLRDHGARGEAVQVRTDSHPRRPPTTLLQPVKSKKQLSWPPGLLLLQRGAFSAPCAVCVGEGLWVKIDATFAELTRPACAAASPRSQRAAWPACIRTRATHEGPRTEFLRMAADEKRVGL